MSAARPMLRVVPAAPAEPLARFCGSCGQPPEPGPAAVARVCARCGMGVLLATGAAAAPAPGAPFLIVDATLAVGGLSTAAEALLQTAEPDAIGCPLTAFLEPADAEATGPEALVAAVLAAAGDPAFSARSVVVRPAGEFGVRFSARVARCGPPPAALVVLA